VEFRLSSHEVMRGIKVRDGRLVLRPAAGSYLFASMEVAMVAFTGAIAVWGVGVSIFTAVITALIAADALPRFRVALIADDTLVTVHNRWRTHRIPIESIDAVRVGIVRSRFRLGLGIGWNPFAHDEITIGVVQAGATAYECEALLAPESRRRAVDPSPAAMKIDVLNRWIAAVRES